MNFFEKEMRQMFGDSDILHDAKFVGKTMLAKLDHDLRGKLQFIPSHISGQFDTVQMSIINRTDGVGDKQNFNSAISSASASAPVGTRWTTICGSTTTRLNGIPPSA